MPGSNLEMYLVMLMAWYAGNWRYNEGPAHDSISAYMDQLWWKLLPSELLIVSEIMAAHWRSGNAARRAAAVRG